MDPRERGYALLILMMLATVLLISLGAALPSIYTEGQREREEELIFRGDEYARAIGRFRRQFNRFPSSVNELLQTNGLRFLRRAYRDPMSRDGKWRFIHASANGALFDSRTQGPASQTAGQKMESGSEGSEGHTFLKVLEKGTPGTTPSLGLGQAVQGAFIAGVASSSSRESIRVWNGRRHYDEWEFLGVRANAAGLQLGVGGQPVAPGQPGLPGQPSAAAPPTKPEQPPPPPEPEDQGPAPPPEEEAPVPDQ